MKENFYIRTVIEYTKMEQDILKFHFDKVPVLRKKRSSLYLPIMVAQEKATEANHWMRCRSHGSSMGLASRKTIRSKM
jgi:hypothetical protein